MQEIDGARPMPAMNDEEHSHKTPWVLDDGFDDNDNFELSVLDSIRSHGMIEVHPNGWGIHDGYGAKSDYLPAKKHPSPKAVRNYLEHGRHESALAESRRQLMVARRVAERAEAARLEAERLQQIKAHEHEAFEAVKSQILAFPHSTDGIAFHTASEFTRFGMSDATRRGITGDEWIWKRSRFLAGFR